jgi:hypothetical protein
MCLDDWFLTADERGDASTLIDDTRRDGAGGPQETASRYLSMGVSTSVSCTTCFDTWPRVRARREGPRHSATTGRTVDTSTPQARSLGREPEAPERRTRGYGNRTRMRSEHPTLSPSDTGTI